MAKKGYSKVKVALCYCGDVKYPHLEVKGACNDDVANFSEELLFAVNALNAASANVNGSGDFAATLAEYLYDVYVEWVEAND